MGKPCDPRLSLFLHSKAVQNKVEGILVSMLGRDNRCGVAEGKGDVGVRD